MKVLQLLFAAVLVIAGVVLLIKPIGAQGPATTVFAPTRFTVVDEGAVGKPDVVMIPGLASSRAVWDGEAKLLAPNYRLHILQVDGFAGTPAGANTSGPMLPGIMEELHGYIVAEKMHPVVIGHSLGGLLTLMLADKYPGDVKKMVIVDTLPFYGMVFNPDATVDMVKPQADAMKGQMLAMPDDQFAAMATMMTGGMVKDADGRKLVAASSIASDRKVFLSAMYEDLQTDIRGDLSTIKVPMLLVYPYDKTLQKDEAAYDSMYHNAYKPMPNATLLRIDDSRHFIMYDQPEKLDAAIEGWLK